MTSTYNDVREVKALRRFEKMTYSDSSYEQSISDHYHNLPEGWQDEEIKIREELQEKLEEEERQRKDKLSQNKNVKQEPE